MRSLMLGALGIVLMAPPALSDGIGLAGTLWQCTRATDKSKFVIIFYPNGGVGGGEFENDEVSPYIFDASRTKPGEWPGQWTQAGQRFTWGFPDQSIRIEGRLSGLRQPEMRITGTETSPSGRSAVACVSLPKLPRVSDGLVIPRDNRFIDLNGDEGELKVPAGISLQDPTGR